MLALLYDIHGNLPALEAVLSECERDHVDRWVLGGDYGAVSPWPLETIERLRELANPTWIRGNGERWLVDPPAEIPEVVEVYARFRGRLPDALIEWLVGLPDSADVDGVLYVHGSPLSDVESFDSEPRQDDERLLCGEHDRTIVFGHSHLQFQRPGANATYLVNPGSVGSPRHGEPNAAWGMRRDDGSFELRRTEYDTARAAAAFRALGGEFGKFSARRIETGSD